MADSYHLQYLEMTSSGNKVWETYASYPALEHATHMAQEAIGACRVVDEQMNVLYENPGLPEDEPEENNEWNGAVVAICDQLVERVEQMKAEGLEVGDTKKQRLEWLLEQLDELGIMEAIEDTLKVYIKESK